MIDPIPGQLSLNSDLAPNVPETGPKNGPTSPAFDASHITDGFDAQGAVTASGVAPAPILGLADVPARLRSFADVPAGLLMTRNWRAWTADTAPEVAALEYRRRLGAWPAAVIRNPKGGHTLAGPMPEMR